MFFYLILTLYWLQTPADGIKERLSEVLQKLKLTDQAAITEL